MSTGVKVQGWKAGDGWLVLCENGWPLLLLDIGSRRLIYYSTAQHMTVQHISAIFSSEYSAAYASSTFHNIDFILNTIQISPSSPSHSGILNANRISQMNLKQVSLRAEKKTDDSQTITTIEVRSAVEITRFELIIVVT